jgi:hypothetical protein
MSRTHMSGNGHEDRRCGERNQWEAVKFVIVDRIPEAFVAPKINRLILTRRDLAERFVAPSLDRNENQLTAARLHKPRKIPGSSREVICPDLKLTHHRLPNIPNVLPPILLLTHLNPAFKYPAPELAF